MQKRPIYKELYKRIKEKRKFIQVLLGPRQVGKTTLVMQLQEDLKVPAYFISADTATLEDLSWIEAQWQIARELLKKHKEAIFIIDEVQKIPSWSTIIKKLWDEDSRKKNNLKVIILGSSPWLMQKGLTESLAGRFEILPITHWSYREMEKIFGFSLEEYIYYGGYPGAAPLIGKKEQDRWQNYINDSLIETTISRDVLLMTQINKPVLLRRLFQIGCHYSGQILSFQKMVGQLQDVGNTTTLAHYLSLLNGAGILAGLNKYANQLIRKRSSSPKFQVFNTALMSVQSERSFAEAKKDKKYWGRLVESAIGAHLLNDIRGSQIELFYWKEGQYEVDFVLKKGKKLVAIEVKSSEKKESLPGLMKFDQAFKPDVKMLVGKDGVAIDQFLKTPVQNWFK